jgi:hypothetical protein
VRCGTVLHANAAYCGACGQAITNRQPAVRTRPSAPTASAAAIILAPMPSTSTVAAGRGVRCCCCLLDVAAMFSPALPLAVAGAILHVPEVLYVVMPVAVAAVWAWMQMWQGYTGMSFGKALLGLRLIGAADHRSPGLAASVTRSGLFGATLGLAALSVVTSPLPRDGMHDRMTGLTMIDIALGANPLGPSRQTALRKSLDRRLNKVGSPVPMATTGRR